MFHVHTFHSLHAPLVCSFVCLLISFSLFSSCPCARDETPSESVGVPIPNAFNCCCCVINKYWSVLLLIRCSRRSFHFISFSPLLLFFSLSPFDFMILFKWFFTQYILLFTYSSAYGFELWKLGTWPAANDNKCALAATTHNMSIFVALYYGIFAGVYMASAMTTNKHRTLIVNVRPRARIKYNWIWLITKWP